VTRQKQDAEPDKEWEDIDEHHNDVFDKDGYFDVMDTQNIITDND
jgi:hypothetical protein